MADVELVIKIPEDSYKATCNGSMLPPDVANVVQGIKNATILPKGHSDLIDVNDIKVIELEDSLHIIRHEKGDEINVYIEAPTVIKADIQNEE